MKNYSFLMPAKDEGAWGQQLRCPVCGYEFVHFEDPNIQYSDNCEAWEGRGDAIRIPMWCESGHKWELRVGFHKGECFIDTENIRKEEHS